MLRLRQTRPQRTMVDRAGRRNRRSGRFWPPESQNRPGRRGSAQALTRFFPARRAPKLCRVRAYALVAIGGPQAVDVFLRPKTRSPRSRRSLDVSSWIALVALL